MPDAPVPVIERKYRVDIIDEQTGAVIQTLAGIPEKHMLRIVQAFTGVGSLLRDLRAVRDVIRRAR